MVTRHLRRLGVPKAHALSPRSLEVVRQLGLPMHTIRKLPAHRRDSMYVRFVTNLAGQQVGALPYERMTLDVLEASPEVRLLFFPGPRYPASRSCTLLLSSEGPTSACPGMSPLVVSSLSWLTPLQMVHNVAQPDLECIIECMMERDFNVDYRKGWTWISHEEVRFEKQWPARRSPPKGRG